VAVVAADNDDVVDFAGAAGADQDEVDNGAAVLAAAAAVDIGDAVPGADNGDADVAFAFEVDSFEEDHHEYLDFVDSQDFEEDYSFAFDFGVQVQQGQIDFGEDIVYLAEVGVDNFVAVAAYDEEVEKIEACID